MDAHGSTDWVEANLTLSLHTRELEVRVRLPAGPCRVADLLPVARSLADVLAADAAEMCRRHGRAITCCRGCGACCRVLAAVAHAEAHHLAGLIQAMAPPRRAAVEERFAHAQQAVRRAGLYDRLLRSELLSDQAARELSSAYVGLHLVCPFLEDSACSIYPDRPIRCREVLVVSPSEHCQAGNPGELEQVDLAAEVSFALARMGQPPDSRAVAWVPLVLAPAWAAGHPDTSDPRPSLDLLRELLERMTGRRPSGAAPPGGEAP